MAKIGIIGAGNMGSAIIKGLLSIYDASDITFSCKTKERADEITLKTGVKSKADNKSCIIDSDVIILAIKPQQYDIVISEISSSITVGKIVISLAPGITIDALQSRFIKGIKIVRAMPNTPALVGESMTGISYDESKLDENDIKLVKDIFSSFGKISIVDEKLMDAVVCVSGSSPALCYMFIDAIAQSGVRHGLKKDVALKMAAQTVLGSAKMVLESREHPAVLRDRVCSPGGTTIEGVAMAEEAGLTAAVEMACDAVYDKATSMKK